MTASSANIQDTAICFCRGYDIYNLSLLLLEIALWQLLGTFSKANLTPEKLHKRFIAISEQNVAHTMGSAYRVAVLPCPRRFETLKTTQELSEQEEVSAAE
jgi:hypothetical protein